MSRRKDQKDSFDKLADHVAQEAIKHDTPFVDKISALKALTQYYQAVYGRKTGDSIDEDDSAPSMTALSAHIHQFSEQPNGSTSPPVRSRRGT